jgi:large subunit ribosomal protein L9
MAKLGFQIDRKRIDLAGTGIKNVGKYKAVIRLYENSQAEIQMHIIGQEIKTETPPAPVRPARRRRDEPVVAAEKPASAEEAPAPAPEEAPAPVENSE